MAAFLEIMNDNYLRFIIFGLSAVLQTITTDCPTALVWHYFGENKSPTSLLASPLDYLPRFVLIQITQYNIRNFGIRGVRKLLTRKIPIFTLVVLHQAYQCR